MSKKTSIFPRRNDRHAEGPEPGSPVLAISQCAEEGDAPPIGAAAPDRCTGGYRPALRRVGAHLVGAAALLPVFVGIYYLSYWLRFEGRLEPVMRHCLSATIGWVVAVKLAWFLAFRACRGWRRCVTFYDLVALNQAALGALLTIAAIDQLLLVKIQIPRSIYLLDWGATIVILGGARCLTRAAQEFHWLLSPAGQIRALIVGVKDGGDLVLRAIHRTGRPTYRVIGCIDDDLKLAGTRIEGVRVIGTLSQTCLLARKYRVQQILVVRDQLSGVQLRQLVDETRRWGVEIRVLPSFRQLIDGSLTVQPRPVSIEDLLQRKPVVLNTAEIRQWIDDRVIMVTGSAGSIGSEISRQLLQFSPSRVVLVDRSETGQFFLDRELRALSPKMEIAVCIADILDEHRVRSLLRRHRPDVIFHAAAYKHVPLMENHPEEAVRNIVVATRQLADLAMEHQVGSFVMVSTDKAVNPTSVMGACKRVAELYVQSLTDRSGCRFVTVRFGNVLDSAGSVVQVFRQQIAAGGPVTVTDPQMRRFFMTIPEAARLVIQAGAIGEKGQILLLDMGEPVRIVDLAADMIRLSGLRAGDDIAIEFVGLRPGEKLFEELHSSHEHRVPTRHPKIIVVDCPHAASEDIVSGIDALSRTARIAPEQTRAQLRRIVREYRSEEPPETLRRRTAA